MQIVLVILIVALIAKDISFVGDPYVLRGTAQALCLAVGGLWLAGHLSLPLLRRYWPPIGYLLALLLATYGTRDPGYVGLQILSLAAVVFFAITYFEVRNRRSAPPLANTTLIRTTVLMYGAIAWLSLVAALYWPSVAYQDINAGNIAGIQVRFRGLFSQAGMMGTAAGLLIVSSLFAVRRLLPKLILVVPGLMCLAMTSSRTYWVAAVAALGLTSLVYRKVRRLWVVGATGAGLFAIATAAAFNIQFDTKAIGKVMRVESISNLTGRVQLWERAIEAFEAQPYLGYGFTAGATGLEVETGGGTFGGPEGLSSRAMGRTTMHSGYVQSLLDSGVIGTIFYLAVIVLSIRSLYRYDRERRFPAEFAALVFLAVANMSEAAIYSASVFSSAFFWILAVFALSLSRVNRPPGGERAERAKHA